MRIFLGLLELLVSIFMIVSFTVWLIDWACEKNTWWAFPIYFSVSFCIVIPVFFGNLYFAIVVIMGLGK